MPLSLSFDGMRAYKARTYSDVFNFPEESYCGMFRRMRVTRKGVIAFYERRNQCLCCFAMMVCMYLIKPTLLDEVLFYCSSVSRLHTHFIKTNSN